MAFWRRKKEDRYITLGLNEPLKPGLIVPEENGEEPDFLYLIMPMRDPSRG